VLGNPMDSVKVRKEEGVPGKSDSAYLAKERRGDDDPGRQGDGVVAKTSADPVRVMMENVPLMAMSTRVAVVRVQGTPVISVIVISIIVRKRGAADERMPWRGRAPAQRESRTDAIVRKSAMKTREVFFMRSSRGWGVQTVARTVRTTAVCARPKRPRRFGWEHGEAEHASTEQDQLLHNAHGGSHTDSGKVSIPSGSARWLHRPLIRRG
jgi:hypothetical protein